MAKARKVDPEGYVRTPDAKDYQRIRDQAHVGNGVGADPRSGRA